MSGSEGCAPLVQIVLMAIAAAITYGVLHDQVTARVCVELLNDN